MKRSSFAYSLWVFLLLLTCALLVGTHVSGNIITTIGGLGTCDGSPALTSYISGVNSMAYNSLGDMYFTLTGQSKIGMISAKGLFQLVAGDGNFAYNGDNIKARDAKLYLPTALVINSKDEIIFTDTGNNRIRKISNGTITTIAGTGVASRGGENVLAKTSPLNAPSGIALAPNGDIYVTEKSRVRKILASNGTISTVAGTSNEGYSGDYILAKLADLNNPKGVSVTSNGEIYIADTSNNRIRKVLTNGTIITVAGNGNSGYNGDGILATNTTLYTPSHCLIDSLGELYIADTYNYVIRKVLTNGTIITIAGKPSKSGNSGNNWATETTLSLPTFTMKSSNGDLLIGDNTRIRKVSPDGYMQAFAGGGTSQYCGDGGNALYSNMFGPKILTTSYNDIYFSDFNQRVRKIFNNGTIELVAGKGEKGYDGDGGPASEAMFKDIGGLAVNSITGEVYISDFDNVRVRSVLPNGTIITIAGNGVAGYNGDGIDGTKAKIGRPYGLAFDSETGDLYIAAGDKIRKLLRNGTIVTHAGLHGEIGSVSYISFDSIQKELYYIDSIKNIIGKVLLNGTIAIVLNPGRSIPGALVFDSHNRELYFTNGESRIAQKILRNGTIITIAGTGGYGDDGDGLDATSATFIYPYGIGLKANGEVVIADAALVRMISTTRTCNGTLANNPNVCGGKGTCVSHDVCECNSLYSGDTCQYDACFLVSAMDSRVCSGNGQCIAPNVCNCSQGYSGNDCSERFYNCFGISSENSLVCSGNGQCVSTNTCNCTVGHFGDNCENSTTSIIDNIIPSVQSLACFGILANDTLNVCNGNGNCSAVDNCTCLSGWIGLNCSHLNISTETRNNITTNNTNPLNNSTLMDNSTLINNNTSVIINSTVNNSSSISNNSTTIDNSTIINPSTSINSSESTIPKEASVNDTVNILTNNNNLYLLFLLLIIPIGVVLVIIGILIFF